MGRFRAVAGTFAGTFPKSAVGTASIGWASGNDLEVVQEQLRHASIETTAIYAKVDRDALRTIARPWPGDVP